jgi:nitronate monooxygenase
MELKSIKIGKHTIKYPIIQGGMGVGISWSGLAGNVSKHGGLGVVSSVGTGYYNNKAHVTDALSFGRPKEAGGFYSTDGLNAIIEDSRAICGDAPLAVNVLYASNDYGRIVTDACKAGANIIITGAGLPTNMPEFSEGFPDVALVPIISSAKALKILCKRWQKRYNRLPDAFILEGPLSGGHQGFSYEQCSMDEFQLENLTLPVIEEAKNWGSMPIIVAGGVWDHDDIAKFIDMGADGVQMATRFIGTAECDASQNFKDLLIKTEEKDIELFKSPVGLPARGIRTNLMNLVDKREGPVVKCISNCVAPCDRGVEAKAVGYCIADRLSDAYEGDLETGLFFTGTNGYRIKKLLTVEELMNKLVNGEDA